MRRLTDAQKQVVWAALNTGLAPCVIASDGRVLPIPTQAKRKWVEPTIVELVPTVLAENE
jgi:hypothetical protein